MRQNRWLLGAGISALVLSALVMFPAQVAFRLLGVPATALAGPSGTLWRGAVQRLAVGSLVLGPVRWQVRPSRLLVGQLAAEVDATLPDGFLRTTAAIALGGDIVASNLEGAAPLAWLAPAVAEADSQVTLRFARLVINGDRIKAANGSLQVSGVVLPIPTTGPKLGPGTYQIAFDAAGLTPEQPLTGALTDMGGPLAIAGTVTLTPPRSYEINGTAKPRPDAPPDLRNALQMLGPATADGGHTLSLAGSF